MKDLKCESVNKSQIKCQTFRCERVSPRTQKSQYPTLNFYIKKKSAQRILFQTRLDLTTS